MNKKCIKPPKGWHCTRDAGHTGPCAALPNKEFWKGKKLCDCPCNGPFCDSWVHPCSKSDEHYSQRDEAEIKIRQDERKRVLKKLMILLEDEYAEWDDITLEGIRTTIKDLT